MSMKLMLLTTDIDMIKEAEEIGIDRIFVDLEYINKRERQRGRDTLISNNTVEDVIKVREVVKKAELLVRVNPMHKNTKAEVDSVIDAGADIVMLPMIVDEYEVKDFINMVNKRAKVSLLLETPQSLARINNIVKVEGIDEIYIGLNDMHIGMQLDFMFELLSGGLVEYLSEVIKKANLPFGFGGMAKIGEGILPSEKILAEHYRLGSNCVILSRTFRNEVGENKPKVNLKEEIEKIREEEVKIQSLSKDDFEKNRIDIIDIVKFILSSKR
ncbi:MAG: aldolase/citrate lyase family protein [Peptostreptococcaceae bacterium]